VRHRPALTGATESPGSSFAYAYDPAGNRTSVSVNGVQQAGYTYNAANEVSNPGWVHDTAGNLTSDGTTSYAFDALGRLTGTAAGSQNRNYAYGDGALVSAGVNGVQRRMDTRRQTRNSPRSISSMNRCRTRKNRCCLASVSWP